MKINSFCEELIPFFRTDGKGKVLKVTSKLLGLLLFTFAPQHIHIFRELNRFFRTGCKDKRQSIPAKSFFPIKIIKSTEYTVSKGFSRSKISPHSTTFSHIVHRYQEQSPRRNCKTSPGTVPHFYYLPEFLQAHLPPSNLQHRSSQCSYHTP